MKSVQIKDDKGPAENLYIGEEPSPSPQKGQVLVKTDYFGLNRMDLLQRLGNYPLPPQAPKTLGVEFSGTIEKSESDKFAVGDKVFGLVYGGAYAEYVVAAEETLLKVPADLSLEVAAGLPEVWFTGIQVLITVGKFQEGDSVLFHAGASSVGIAVIQLAASLGASKIFTTVGSDEKCEFVKKLGNKFGVTVVPINYHKEDFKEVVSKHYDASKGEGVNVIIDPVGQSYFVRNLEIAAKDARIVLMGAMSGPIVKGDVPIGLIIYKRLVVQGTTLRSRDLAYQEKLRDFFVSHVIPLISEGKIDTFVDKLFNFTTEDLIASHKYLESNKSMGKVIVKI